MSYFDETTLAAIASGILQPRTFITVYFDEGTAGYWSEAGAVTLNGVTYSGNCAVGAVEGVEGNTDFSMADVTVQLSAADPAIAGDFATKTWHLRRIVFQDMLFDPTMRTVYPTPLESYPALIGNARMSQKSGDVAAITLELLDLMEVGVIGTSTFRTDGDQRSTRLSTDSIFRSIAYVEVPYDLYWGQRIPAYGHAAVRGQPLRKI